MRQNLLLLKDVEDLGKSGEIVSVRSGYARNYILPKKLGIVADKHTMRMQKKLQEERAKKAIEDKKDAEKIAEAIALISLETKSKVDPEGKMYGSVSAQDIINLLEEKNIKLDKKNIQLKHPIKEIGTYDIVLKLKEGVEASCKLTIIPEGKVNKKEMKKAPKKETEALPQEEIVEEVETLKEEKTEEEKPQE